MKLTEVELAIEISKEQETSSVIETEDYKIEVSESEDEIEVNVENYGERHLRPSDVTSILVKNNVSIGKVIHNGGKVKTGDKARYEFVKIHKTKRKGKK